MLERFLALERWTTRVAMIGAVVMLIVSVLLGFYQVLTRFVFDAPSTWSEVISRSAMIWCVFLGAAAGFRGGFMMSVEVIYKLVASRRLIWIETLIALCCVVALWVLIQYGTAMTWRVRSQMLSGLGISIAWAYAAMPVGSALALVSVLARLAAQWGGLEPVGVTAGSEAEDDDATQASTAPVAAASDVASARDKEAHP